MTKEEYLINITNLLKQCSDIQKLKFVLVCVEPICVPTDIKFIEPLIDFIKTPIKDSRFYSGVSVVLNNITNEPTRMILQCSDGKLDILKSYNDYLSKELDIL